MQQDLVQCHKSIAPFIHRTPVMTSSLIKRLLGMEVFFKCENFQRMGAFKMRGAVYAIQKLSNEEKKKGVVTHSSGNFAQALSLAAKSLEIPAYVVMPANAPEVKKEAVRSYGGTITECNPDLESRQKTTAAIIAEKGAVFIHPSNDYHVILGQGTAAKELLEDHPDLSFIFVPVGGGGLIAGSCLAAKHFGNQCAVIGGEPENADDAYRSLKSGKIESNLNPQTIADGLRTELGTINFPIIKGGVKKIIRVSESEIIAAMKLIWERLKIVVEPSSAVALAALIKEKSQYRGARAGIILSGGNVDLKKLPF